MAESLLADTPPRSRYCAGCSHVHGGRAFGLCLVRGCPCITVQVAPPDLSPDPWLVPRWRRCDRATCDGCGKPDCPVMRVEGGGIAMCERCHVRFMDDWRARDAASERGESVDGYRDHVAGAAAFEQDDDELPQQQRSAA